MPWLLRLVAGHEEATQTGDAYYSEDMRTLDERLPLAQANGVKTRLSERYLRESAGWRPPLVIRLPGGNVWCVDRRAYSYDNGGFYGEGWEVVGLDPANPQDLSKLTCRLSIRCGSDGDSSGYHGHVRDGVITDDEAGRTYDT